MSNCHQNIHGDASNVTILNIKTLTYQENTQEAPRRKTQQTNLGKCGCIFRKQIKSIIKLSKSKEVNQRSRDNSVFKSITKKLCQMFLTVNEFNRTCFRWYDFILKIFLLGR